MVPYDIDIITGPFLSVINYAVELNYNAAKTNTVD